MNQFDLGFEVTEAALSSSFAVNSSAVSNKSWTTSVAPADFSDVSVSRVVERELSLTMAEGKTNDHPEGWSSLIIKRNNHSRLRGNTRNSRNALITDQIWVAHQKDWNTSLARKWYRAMRGNNAPRHLVPHQMNVQLRRYPESAFLRALSLIGKTSLTLERSTFESLRVHNFRSRRAPFVRLDGLAAGGHLHRGQRKATTRHSVDFLMN